MTGPYDREYQGFFDALAPAIHQYLPYLGHRPVAGAHPQARDFTLPGIEYRDARIYVSSSLASPRLRVGLTIVGRERDSGRQARDIYRDLRTVSETLRRAVDQDICWQEDKLLRRGYYIERPGTDVSDISDRQAQIDWVVTMLLRSLPIIRPVLETHLK